MNAIDPQNSNAAESIGQLYSITAEIAERLNELDELKFGFGIDVVNRLSDLAAASQSAYRLTIRLMHGDARAFLSFEAQAQERGLSKQSVHKEFTMALDRIEMIFPELAALIQQARDNLRDDGRRRGRIEMVGYNPGEADLGE